MGCQENKFDDHLLSGDWSINTWKVLSTGNMRDNSMDMSFNDDGTYTIDYGSEKENGKFWISDEYLHTVETGMAEKKVRITQLVKDSFSFEMNRGGSLESVLMLRKE